MSSWPAISAWRAFFCPTSREVTIQKLVFPEYSTESNARILARNIRAYWIAEGFAGIEVEVRRDVDHPNAPYRIFSNISNRGFKSVGRNGFPPGGRGEPDEKNRSKDWRV